MVLLIEDDWLFAAQVRDAVELRAGRFELVHVESMRSGIDLMRNADIACVVLDLFLPDSGGLGAVARIRRELPGVPVVVSTAHDDPSFILDALRAGAADYVVKGSGEGWAATLWTAVANAIAVRVRPAPASRPAPLPRGEELLTPRDAAALLHVSPHTLARWAALGRVPCVLTLGGHRRFSRSTVEELAARR